MKDNATASARWADAVFSDAVLLEQFETAVRETEKREPIEDDFEWLCWRDTVNLSEMKLLRVLHEDGDFVTFEMAKRDDVQLRVEDGDQFYTVAFIHQVDGETSVWDPWNQ